MSSHSRTSGYADLLRKLVLRGHVPLLVLREISLEMFDLAITSDYPKLIRYGVDQVLVMRNYNYTTFKDR